MKIDSTVSGGTLVLTVQAQRIDSAAAIRFKDAIRAETRKTQGRVVMDLHPVRFVDSSGLGAIVATMKQLGPERRLDLAGLTDDVDKVFRLTRMDTIFNIYDDAASAAAATTG